MSRALCWIITAGLLLIGIQECTPSPEATVLYRGQGTMAGAVTATSAILQSRLTSSDTLVKGDIPGAEGVACFEVATDSGFLGSKKTPWMTAASENDFIIKMKVEHLRPATRYYYRLVYGSDRDRTSTGRTCTFCTLAGAENSQPVEFVVVTGMKYHRFYHSGEYPGDKQRLKESRLGYPVLRTIREMAPDFLSGPVIMSISIIPMMSNGRKRKPGSGRNITSSSRRISIASYSPGCQRTGKRMIMTIGIMTAIIPAMKSLCRNWDSEYLRNSCR